MSPKSRQEGRTAVYVRHRISTHFEMNESVLRSVNIGMTEMKIMKDIFAASRVSRYSTEIANRESVRNQSTRIIAFVRLSVDDR